MKLLLSAYACEPGLGSEPGVGWNSVLQAARFHDVWVLTREVNRKGIEQAPAPPQLARVHFVYLDLPSELRFWKKGRRGLYLYYYLWQILAYRRAVRLHREIGFDAVQHVTFVNYLDAQLAGAASGALHLGTSGGRRVASRVIPPTLGLARPLSGMAP